MDYDAIVAVHSGGQHGAAALYREWGTGQAPWCAQGTRAHRADVRVVTGLRPVRPVRWWSGSVLPILRTTCPRHSRAVILSK